MTTTQERDEQGERNNRAQVALAKFEAEMDALPEGDNDEADLYDPRDPSPAEMRGMFSKPSDFNPRRERFRGIAI